MNAAACPNKKCNAFINFECLEASTTSSCEKCHTTIQQDFFERFNETVDLTKSHVENMKDIAC